MDHPFLPVEIVNQIIEQVSSEKSAIYQRLATLRSCRSVCQTLNEIAIPHLYRHIIFNGPHSFAKFLDELRAHPTRGRLVRTLDFSAFTSVGLGRSRTCNTRILLLTAQTLNECLLLCPNVQEVFLSEALELDIDVAVFETLFLRLQKLEALDFCASDSPEFVQSFVDFMQRYSTWTSDLSHLSLHNCSTLPTTFFEDFIPRFRNLIRLDLYNTQISGETLLSIHSTCRLQVLNLSQCTRVSASALLLFMTSHTSSTNLKQLNLLFSWNKTHPLSTAPQALDLFVQNLPRKLQVLDLGGLELDAQHLEYLPPALIELGAHDIDIGAHHTEGAVSVDNDHVSDALKPVLKNLKYLLLTQNVISSETKFASILNRLFPELAILESPGFSRLPFVQSLAYRKVDGAGRRDWIERRGFASLDVESNGKQWHPRKSNMSLTNGVPRGIYDYYSYRV